MPLDNEKPAAVEKPAEKVSADKLVKFKFGQPWNHRGVFYKAGEEVELSAADVRMLTEDFKAHEAKQPTKPAK